MNEAERAPQLKSGGEDRRHMCTASAAQCETCHKEGINKLMTIQLPTFFLLILPSFRGNLL